MFLAHRCGIPNALEDSSYRPLAHVQPVGDFAEAEALLPEFHRLLPVEELLGASDWKILSRPALGFLADPSGVVVAAVAFQSSGNPFLDPYPFLFGEGGQ